MALSTLEQQNLIRVIARLNERIGKLEAVLNGQPISDVRIASLSASKLTAGIISVMLGVGDEERIIIDGANNRIVIYDEDGDARIIIGKHEGGF